MNKQKQKLPIYKCNGYTLKKVQELSKQNGIDINQVVPKTKPELLKMLKSGGIKATAGEKIQTLKTKANKNGLDCNKTKPKSKTQLCKELCKEMNKVVPRIPQQQQQQQQKRRIELQSARGKTDNRDPMEKKIDKLIKDIVMMRLSMGAQITNLSDALKEFEKDKEEYEKSLREYEKEKNEFDTIIKKSKKYDNTIKNKKEIEQKKRKYQTMDNIAYKKRHIYKNSKRRAVKLMKYIELLEKVVSMLSNGNPDKVEFERELKQIKK